jgi:hypothetical protein
MYSVGVHGPHDMHMRAWCLCGRSDDHFPGGVTSTVCWGESSVRRVGIFRVQWFKMG